MDVVDDQPGRFPNTRWTLVRSAGEGLNAHALAELLRLYAPALRAHLRFTIRDDHRVEDLVQGFLTDKVIEQRLIGYADPARGRFRTFLLTALDRYVIDQIRRTSAQKRSPRDGFHNLDEHSDSLHASTDQSVFDRAWATQVVEEVLSAMRQHCEMSDRRDLWDVFEVRYLKPAIEGAEPEPHESIARRLGLASPEQAANLLVTSKRMFTRHFKAAVARYSLSDDEVREEVAELWRLFADARG